jgi:hypothetical protein
MGVDMTGCVVFLMVSLASISSEPASLPVVSTLDVPHRVSALALSVDGKIAVAAGPHGSVTLWQTGDGKRAGTGVGSHDDATCAAISDNSEWIAVGGIEGNVTVFSSKTGAVVYRKDVHGSRLLRVAFSAGSKLLASTCWDGQARVWHAHDGADVSMAPATTIGLGGHVFDPVSESLLLPAMFADWAARPNIPTASPIHEIDPLTGKTKRSLTALATHWILAIDRDAKRVAAGDEAGNVLVIDRSTGKIERTIRVASASGSPVGTGIVGLAFARGETLWAITMNGQGGLFAVDTGRRIATFDRPNDDFLAAASARDVPLAVVSAWNKRIEVVRLAVNSE